MLIATTQNSPAFTPNANVLWFEKQTIKSDCQTPSMNPRNSSAPLYPVPRYDESFLARQSFFKMARLPKAGDQRLRINCSNTFPMTFRDF